MECAAGLIERCADSVLAQQSPGRDGTLQIGGIHDPKRGSELRFSLSALHMCTVAAFSNQVSGAHVTGTREDLLAPCDLECKRD